MDVRQELLSCADINYKEFHKKLVPTVDENKIIGVRIPQLRKIGKSLKITVLNGISMKKSCFMGFI